MGRRWRQRILTVALGIACLGLLFGAGRLSEWLGFPGLRTTTAAWSARASERWRAWLTEVQGKLQEDREARKAPWAVPLHRVEEALARGDVSVAEQAWHDAFGAALRSRRWEGWLAVGDAYLRIGEATGAPSVARAKARRLYQAALFHARSQNSLDGVLRAAEAFGALGDREMVDHGIRIAETLADSTRDPVARAQVAGFTQRLSQRIPEGRGPVAGLAGP